MAQIVLNNRQSTIINESVFYDNYGQHPKLFIASKNSLQAMIVLKDVK